MFEILPDLGLIIIGVALFGFILKDAYNWELFQKPPTIYKQQYISTIFHYISIGLFALSILIIFTFFSVFAPNQDNLISKFFNFMFTFIQVAESSGVLASGFSTSIKNNLVLSFFPAFFYFGTVSVVLAIGRFARFMNEVWVNVEFNDGEKSYPNVISDDDDFFYFEQPDNPGFWEAIRKENVKKITLRRHPSRFRDKFSSYFGKLSDLYSKKQYGALIRQILNDTILYVPFVFLIILLIFSPH
jgi:hypothetical protein